MGHTVFAAETKEMHVHQVFPAFSLAPSVDLFRDNQGRGFLKFAQNHFVSSVSSELIHTEICFSW